MNMPKISFVVIVYNMRRQAMNTLYSLSAAYQQDVDADDYEIIVVENRSSNNLDPEAIAALNGRFRYLLRDEPGVSPAAAINAGVQLSQSDTLCLMIDGARMLSPGVVRFMLEAFRITPFAMAIVPGYNLGEHEQQYSAEHGYSEEKEMQLLSDISWPQEGYRLFEISCLSGANPNGVFHPLMECNCLGMAKSVFHEIGGADERFDMPGGGALNLAIYRKVATHPKIRPYLLAGEGSFHQIHGGVTTSGFEGRDALLMRQRDQLNSILGTPFKSPTVQPVLLGTISAPAMGYLQFSVEKGILRAANFARRGAHLYADDLARKST